MQRPGGVFFSFGKHPVDRIGLQHFQDNDGRKVIIRPSNQPKLSKAAFGFFSCFGRSERGFFPSSYERRFGDELSAITYRLDCGKCLVKYKQ